MRSASVFVKTIRLPSGLQCMLPGLAPDGNTIEVSAPSESRFSVIFVKYVERCGPLVFGLIRRPAMRSAGSAKSAIGG